MGGGAHCSPAPTSPAPAAQRPARSIAAPSASPGGDKEGAHAAPDSSTGQDGTPGLLISARPAPVPVSPPAPSAPPRPTLTLYQLCIFYKRQNERRDECLTGPPVLPAPGAQAPTLLLRMKFRLPRLWVLGVPGTPPFSEELSDPFSTMVPASGSGGGRLGGRSCSRFRRDGELLGVLRPEWGVVLGAGRGWGLL